MLPPQKMATLVRNRDGKIENARRFLASGRYPEAERILRETLSDWRREGGPKTDEGGLIGELCKALEAQRKYEEAYELYMETLNNLSGTAYDELYSQFLYLNQRMGSFDRRQDYS